MTVPITAPPTTEPPVTAAPTTAPPEAAPPTTAAPAPATATPVSSTPAATTDTPTDTGDDSVTESTVAQPDPVVEDPNVLGTTVPSGDPTTDPIADPTAGPTIPTTDEDDVAPASTTDVAPTTLDPSTSTSGTEQPSGDADVPPGSADGTETESETETGTTEGTTTTVDPKSTVAEGTGPQNAVVVPTETTWTLGLSVTGGWTYSGPFNLYLRSRFGGSTVSLQDGGVSGPLVRPVGQAYYVRVEMGSSYDPAFGFRWECTGDVSGLSTGTTEQFTPNVDPFDSTMVCVFIVDNTNPPTLILQTEVLGDPSGLVAFSTTAQYNFFGIHPLATVSSVAGSSHIVEGVAGFRVDVASVATGSTPPNTQTSTTCVDAAGTYVGGSGLSAGWSASNFGPGARITCTITHSVPGTITIVEDVVPDDPAAPAGDYSKSRFERFIGPDAWSLADGESQQLTFVAGGFSDPSFTRTETPGWDLTDVVCLEQLAGGATQPYSNFTFSLGSTSARAFFPVPPPGTDIVCRFIVEPSGPPSLSLSVDPNVFDESTLSGFEVTVRGPFDVVLGTLTFPAGGGSQSLPLDPSAGNHTLQLTDDQGLDLSWGCDAVVSTTDTITFPTILGETVSCSLLASDPFPTGTASITLLKDDLPDDYGYQYRVRVTQGDFVLGSGVIFDGGPGLVIDNVALGDFTVTETGYNTDYELASVDCVDGTPSTITRTAGVDPGDDGSSFRIGTFTLDTVTGNTPDADTTCTLVNSPSTTPAILRIETATNPAGDAQSFDYEISPASQLTSGTSSFSQADGDEVSRGLQAGFVTIEQQPAAGYTTRWDCGATGSILTPVDGFEAGVFVEAGFDYTCRFVNTSVAVATATLDVVTDVEPTDATLFGYSITPASRVTGADPAIFAQGDGATTSRTTTVDAPITVTQVTPVGYVTTSSCVEGGVVIASGQSSVTYTPARLDDVVCTFVHEPLPKLTIIERVEPDGIAGTDSVYTTDTPGLIVVGPATYDLADDESQTLTIDAGVTFSVLRSLSVDRRSAGVPVCEVSDNGSSPTLYLPVFASDNSVFVNGAPGEQIFCTFTAVPPPQPVDLAIELSIDTGVTDRSDEFEFRVQVSGVGVGGPGGVGTAQFLDLRDLDSEVVSVLDGTDVAVRVDDDKAGTDGFRAVIDCGNAAGPVTNAAANFPVAAGQACTITLSARTITVLKNLQAPAISGFDDFEFRVEPAVSDGEFFLQDGEETNVVVPLGQTIELTEIDSGPYDGVIECTENTAFGPVRPYLGPIGFSNTIEITDPTLNPYCEVFNFEAGPVVHEVVITSRIDLGPVATPDDLPGFLVDLDGDFALDDEGGPFGPAALRFDPSGPFGPGSSSLQSLPGSGIVVSSLLASRFIEANGSISFFVDDGSDLTIGAGLGSEQFANTIGCGFGDRNPDGSLTLPAISGPVACDLVSSAGVLEVRHEVEGTPPVAFWPYSITQVVAGDEAVMLGDNGTSLSAVAASRPLTVSLNDLQGASSVSSSCAEVSSSLLTSGPIVTPPPFGRLAVAAGEDIEVTVPGGSRWRCSFVATYSSTTPTTTTPGATPTTTTPTVSATTIPTPPTVPTTTTPTTTSTGSTPTTTRPPFVPFAPVPTRPTATPTTPTVPPSDSTPTTPTPTASTPTSVLTSSDPEPAAPETTVAPPEPDDDPPLAITSTDVPEDIYVDIGDPIPVEVDCAGELVITVNGVLQERVDQIDPSVLGLGDHVINVSCDGEEITSVRAVVFEQEESAPGGRNMTVIVMFVVMASAAFLFAPSAAGRKRLPV